MDKEHCLVLFEKKKKMQKEKEKSLQTLMKSIWTSFQEWAALKSWLKYITAGDNTQTFLEQLQKMTAKLV